MMGVLVLACRTATPAKVIDEVRDVFKGWYWKLTLSVIKLYGARGVFIPKMPSLGLLLEQPIFDSYNKRVTVINENLQQTSPDFRPPIDFEIYSEEIKLFKQKHIYDNMRTIEDKRGLYNRSISSRYTRLLRASQIRLLDSVYRLLWGERFALLQWPGWCSSRVRHYERHEKRKTLPGEEEI